MISDRGCHLLDYRALCYTAVQHEGVCTRLCVVYMPVCGGGGGSKSVCINACELPAHFLSLTLTHAVVGM